jgi:tripartite-type tricarboxylate transporter receptor subunit TctC
MSHPLSQAGSVRRAALARMLCAAIVPAWASGSAVAAEFLPNRPVKAILPLPPGGAADRMLRVVTNRLEVRWKQPVVVDSKPGAGSVVGMQALATSPPDGHTLALTSGLYSINAARSDLPKDIFKELRLVSRIGFYTLGLVAAGTVPANDIKSLIALAKKDPASYPYASTGVGTPQNLAGEMFNQMAGLNLTHIPYNGAGKLLTDMVGGRLPLCFAVLTSAEGFIKTGQVKVLGVTSARRSPLFPDVPAIAETIPGYETVSWSGFVVPATTPTALVRQLSDDIVAVTREPEVVKAMAEMGFELDPLGLAEFEAFVKLETAKYVPIVKRMGKF